MVTNSTLNETACAAIGRLPFVTAHRIQPSTGTVSGRIGDKAAFYVAPRVSPERHYMMHLRGLSTDNTAWSTAHAEQLGGIVKPANEGNNACVEVRVQGTDAVCATLRHLATLVGGWE